MFVMITKLYLLDELGLSPMASNCAKEVCSRASFIVFLICFSTFLVVLVALMCWGIVSACKARKAEVRQEFERAYLFVKRELPNESTYSYKGKKITIDIQKKVNGAVFGNAEEKR